MAKIDIKDESGDRKYFTQIPNYIANHSTAIDQALYFQMKRFAGEDGKCFATQETLRKKLGIGKQAYNKSLKYLLDKKWIRFIGMTGGKTRPIKTYAIVDIWKLNIMEYEKISPETAVSFNEISPETAVSFNEISLETDGDKSQNGSKISPRTAIEEEPSKEELLRRTTAAKPLDEVNLIINIFQTINPGINYANSTNRKSAEWLISKYGFEKASSTAEYAVICTGKPYAPTITTPYQLKEKLGSLIAFYKKETAEGNKTSNTLIL